MRAQDVDGDTLTYSIDPGIILPPGLTFNGSTGLLSWPSPDVPTGSSVAIYPILVWVYDGHGGADYQYFELSIFRDYQLPGPEITSQYRPVAQIGLPYLYQVTATNPSNGVLTFSVVPAGSGSVPNGVHIDPQTGLLQWTPTQDQLGMQTFFVYVSDGRGASANQPVAILVATHAINHPPEITSSGSDVGIVGREYVYDPVATDEDNDPLVWSLPAHPEGMSIDPITGAIRWMPTEEQIGQQHVKVEVTDPFGVTAVEDYYVTVRGVNSPPKITSEAPTRTGVNQLYTYAVRATDADHDPLTFSLIDSPPAGMTIDAATGLIQWTSSVVVTVPVTVQVSDGLGGIDKQPYTLQVTQTGNRPPDFTYQSPQYAPTGRPYQYQIQATDPDGDTLTYTLTTSPAIQSNPPTISSSGLIQWAQPVAGTYIFTAKATDPFGLFAEGDIELHVRADVAPTIDPIADQTVTAGLPFIYAVHATDAENDPLTFSASSVPSVVPGLVIDATGLVYWRTGIPDIGNYTISVTATDNYGATSAPRTFALHVAADTEAPQVELQIAPNPAYIGQEVSLFVALSDNVAAEIQSLTINGANLFVDGYGFATVTENMVGQYSVVATAKDTAGNTRQATQTLTVIDPAVTNAPAVSLSSPANDQNITAPVDVVGTVTDPNLLSYTLSDAPLEGGSVNQFAHGSISVINGVVGRFDPTLLADGSYIITLLATNSGGHSASASIQVEVTGNFKVGNFKIGFSDLLIPLGGLPIIVNRTYDSLDAGTSRDFGFGWSLSFRDVKLRASIPSDPFTSVGQYPAFRDGTRVYVTLPGGHREGFTFEAAPVSLLGATLTYLPSFVPDAGVFDQLAGPDTNLIKLGDDYVTMDTGWLTNYNPANPDLGSTYTLTTHSGLAYNIDARYSLLRSVSDRHGNTLTFTDSGITSSAGTRVAFDRDPQGRIISITDPAGQDCPPSRNECHFSGLKD